jgi:hypothetical protein
MNNVMSCNEKDMTSHTKKHTYAKKKKKKVTLTCRSGRLWICCESLLSRLCNSLAANKDMTKISLFISKNNKKYNLKNCC